MDITAVIAQIKSLCPIFNGNVAGGVSHIHGIEDQVWLPLPAAYVVPSSDEAAPNSLQSGFEQIVTERISVEVELDNSADRRGQTAAEQVHSIRYALYKALLNWRPDWDPEASTNPQNRESRGMYFVSGELIGWDRARMFWRFEFALDATITDLDGWQQPTAPLTDIREYVTDQISGETLVVGDTPLPQ